METACQALLGCRYADLLCAASLLHSHTRNKTGGVWRAARLPRGPHMSSHPFGVLLAGPRPCRPPSLASTDGCERSLAPWMLQPRCILCLQQAFSSRPLSQLPQLRTTQQAPQLSSAAESPTLHTLRRPSLLLWQCPVSPSRLVLCFHTGFPFPRNSMDKMLCGGRPAHGPPQQKASGLPFLPGKIADSPSPLSIDDQILLPREMG